jgi:hypothetical protein
MVLANWRGKVLFIVFGGGDEWVLIAAALQSTEYTTHVGK